MVFFSETPSDVVDGGEEGLKTADGVGPGAHGKEGRTSEVEKRSESPETGSIAGRAKSMKRGRRVFLSKVSQRSTIPDLQQCPVNLRLIKIFREILVFFI